MAEVRVPTLDGSGKVATRFLPPEVVDMDARAQAAVNRIAAQQVAAAIPGVVATVTQRVMAEVGLPVDLAVEAAQAAVASAQAASQAAATAAETAVTAKVAGLNLVVKDAAGRAQVTEPLFQADVALAAQSEAVAVWVLELLGATVADWLVPDPVLTGLYLQTGSTALTATSVPGLYDFPVGQQIVPTSTPGMYQLIGA